MPARDIVVVGASSGGIEALRTLVGGLPNDFPASLFVVLHVAPQSPGILADILERAGRLPAANARNGERMRPHRIYVASPDHHLVLEPGVVRVTRGPRENRFRPAVDPLFRSAAQVYGPRVTGVILTGGLDDGTAGLWAVKRLGGVAVVQDPQEALAPSMPESALRHVQVDYCLPLAQIAPLLVRLASEPMTEKGAQQVSEEMDIEVKIAKEDKALDIGVLKLGAPSHFTCPECHGVLLQLKEGERVRFRCHTGHAYSLDSLLAEIEEMIEESLWSSIRSIDENVMLLQQVAQHLRDHADADAAELFLNKAQDALRRSDLVRQAVMNQSEPGAVQIAE
ncbi:MAG: chemotaxis protein CheB [Pyrinomonadaceae bacterium]